MISKYKYINFQYNLQEVMEILPNIDGLPGRHKIQSLNYYQKKELEKVIKSNLVFKLGIIQELAQSTSSTDFI